MSALGSTGQAGLANEIQLSAPRAAAQAEGRPQLRGGADDRRAWDEALSQAVGRWFGTPLQATPPDTASQPSPTPPGPPAQIDSTQAAGLAAIRSALRGGFATPAQAVADELSAAGDAPLEVMNPSLAGQSEGSAGGQIEAGPGEDAVSRIAADLLARWTEPAELSSPDRAELRSRSSAALPDDLAEAGAGAPRPAAESGGGDPARRESVRWHAEWRPDGLHLWLGVDENPSLPLPQLTQLLLQELRPQLEARGARLVSLVCNGRLLETAAATPAPDGSGPEPSTAPPPSAPRTAGGPLHNPLDPQETP
jgi:hypothetical protein